MNKSLFILLIFINFSCSANKGVASKMDDNYMKNYYPVFADNRNDSMITFLIMPFQQPFQLNKTKIDPRKIDLVYKARKDTSLIDVEIDMAHYRVTDVRPAAKAASINFKRDFKNLVKNNANKPNRYIKLSDNVQMIDNR